MARVRFRTDFRLWLLAAGGLFASLGFVDPVAGVAKGDNSLWSYVARFVTGDYFCSTTDIVIPILFRSALQAIPAAALGWIVQAVVVVAWGTRRPQAPNQALQQTAGRECFSVGRCRSSPRRP